MSLGSNGVDWVRSLRKIRMWLRGTNFCINYTSSHLLHRVSCSSEMITDEPKHYETYQNMSLWSNGVDWERSLRKIPTWLHGTNFCIKIAPVHTVLNRVSFSYETIPNAPKHYTTHQNMSL